jgi:hypothetical protein
LGQRRKQFYSTRPLSQRPWQSFWADREKSARKQWIRRKWD